MAAPILWAPEKSAFFLQENLHAHKISFGGYLFFFFGGGGSANFIFMDARIFLNHVAAERVLPRGSPHGGGWANTPPSATQQQCTVSRQMFTRNCPHPNCLFKCLQVASPLREGYRGICRGFAKGWFPKGWFWRMFPGVKNRNEGTFGCSAVPKTGTRAHSPKPPFYETALLFPLEFIRKAQMSIKSLCPQNCVPPPPEKVSILKIFY